MILLILIYLAFISLGLPDSILGSAWPSMYGQLQVPVSYAGVITMLISGGTIVSSLLSHRLIRRFGTGSVTAVSVALTAAALFGFSITHSFWLLCVWSIPYGLGAGSVDAALNNFVALHYKARHMSWLHCFWGIGATLGPIIMGLSLTGGFGWHTGYRTIGLAQTALVICLLASLPLWKHVTNNTVSENGPQETIRLSAAFRLPGAKAALFAFFCYCSLEATAGVWAGSYLVLHKGVAPETAAKWAAAFYLGITAGRFLSGFVAEKAGNRKMVRLGQAAAGLGTLILLLPLGPPLTLAGLLLTGIGCAPIYPSLLHATPVHFGADRSQAMMGMQMASAYVGTTLMPLLFGFAAGTANIKAYPLFLLLFVLMMVSATEVLNRRHL
jgi:fucose permease